MAALPLNNVIRRAPIASPRPSSAWILSEQYIGIEIETEGLSGRAVNTFDAARQPWWTYHNDPSLRNNGIEFTLTNPYMGQDLLDAIGFFYNTVSIPAQQSLRTSTHLHLNMQQESDTTDVLRALVAIYYAVEPAFYDLVAGDRKWSGYCHSLDARQTESISMLFSDAGDVDIQEWYLGVHTLSRLGGGRYYGLNLAALLKYGTIEFRHFPCAVSRQQLMSYINLIMELKAAAVSVANDPRGVMGFLTSNQDFAFLAQLMPTWGRRLLDASPQGQAGTRLGKLIASASRRSYNFNKDTHPVIEKFMAKQDGKKVPAKKRATAVRPRVAPVSYGDGSAEGSYTVTEDTLRGDVSGATPLGRWEEYAQAARASVANPTPQTAASGISSSFDPFYRFNVTPAQQDAAVSRQQQAEIQRLREMYTSMPQTSATIEARATTPYEMPVYPYDSEEI